METEHVLLKTYSSRTDANLDKSYLASENIESFIVADDLGGQTPFPYQPVLLKVRRADFAKAQELIVKLK